MPTTTSYAAHSRYSDPGRFAELLQAVDPDPAAIHAAVTNAVIHYRAEAGDLVDDQSADIDSRWIEAILARYCSRGESDLTAPREPGRRVAGCCRDHTLLAVAILREHGVPARSRHGFAGYFREGFHHDHVVGERWDGQRWVRFDAELGADDFPFDVADMPVGDGAPFVTAAEAWLAHRTGRVDVSTYGVDPSLPQLGGHAFVREYVIGELAARQRDEMLLWDLWGAMVVPDDVGRVVPPGVLSGVPETEADALVDEVAALLVAADAGDAEAEAELGRRYVADARLRPGERVLTASPSGRVGVTDLDARATDWVAASSFAVVAGE
ncbi:transglutaminase domain protein [Beutenbergia cavernae DSM 12333]|uniref:Transglutaminase domain protein n=1 Tax=Beutenbergia cavernae (strain ATCC BAA-8 / DSM 12333 / CCUG 43141 / JCM 11478 / NBRC 16432 / NCIMB 13614 / HKI 0122) TaxID=471853 RepID=C5C3X3_BEUC1|nr:transglutaminase-like domain-containing protein [Beutenbergia cavernae]ACQ79886.1 transglutaminase domain protein [Beutenbergia cavernae DSM 12333]